ncbi:MAG: hypothetical protein ACUVQ1_02015 [Candidatus Kapaibacteriales bacterium]
MPESFIKKAHLFNIVAISQLLLLSTCQIGECPICEVNNELSGKWNSAIKEVFEDSITVYDLTLNILVKRNIVYGSYFIESISQYYKYKASSPIFGEYINGYLTLTSLDSLISFECYNIPSSANSLKGTLKLMQKVFEIELKKI